MKNALRDAGPELTEALGLTRMMEDTSGIDTAAFPAIARAAERGSPEALAMLGRCFERGVLVKRDAVRAAVEYIRAIRMDSPRGSALLLHLVQQAGFLHELKLRADNGEAEAEYAWAGIAALGFDIPLTKGQAMLTGDQALHFLRMAAAQHFPQALVELGLSSYAGRWVQRDVGQAEAYWREAASLGSREASIRLAIMGVREGRLAGMEDPIALLRTAAREGSVLAEVALAYCYETGQGVATDASTAARLYATAAQRGSQDAYRALRRMLDAIRPPDPEFKFNDLSLGG